MSSIGSPCGAWFFPSFVLVGLIARFTVVLFMKSHQKLSTASRLRLERLQQSFLCFFLQMQLEGWTESTTQCSRSYWHGSHMGQLARILMSEANLGCDDFRFRTLIWFGDFLRPLFCRINRANVVKGTNVSNGDGTQAAVCTEEVPSLFQGEGIIGKFLVSIDGDATVVSQETQLGRPLFQTQNFSDHWTPLEADAAPCSLRLKSSPRRSNLR